MAGALNKQGRLLYFYGLGGGSGSGFCGASTSGIIRACGTPLKERLPFPVETEIPTRHCVGLQ